jgi:hypothetical protein
MTTTPNTAAGGQILTEERIAEIADATGMMAKNDVLSRLDGGLLCIDFARAIEADLRASFAAVPASEPEHRDDIAVDKFSIAMKARMKQKRANGRKGWENPKKCSFAYLMDLLKKTPLSKPVDIGNYAMMLFNRAVMENEGYPANASHPTDENSQASESFDAWQRNPYTKVLQKSIAEDYVPKDSAAAPAPVSGMPDLAKLTRYGTHVNSSFGAGRYMFGETARGEYVLLSDVEALFPSPQAPDTPNPTGETK